MKLYLVRHGIAEDRAVGAFPSDDARSLTEKGRHQIRTVAAALKNLKVDPERIVASPYLRAKQTAELLAETLEYRSELAFSETLMPTGDARDIIETINENHAVERLMLVGHEPCLSRLIGVLIAGRADLAIDLKKGGVCRLASDAPLQKGLAILEWLVTPKMLRRAPD